MNSGHSLEPTAALSLTPNFQKPTGRVLIVDDEPQVRNALARLFRLYDVDLVVAATAEEALALAEGETLAAVVTDIQMPGISGLALLERLTSLQPRARFVVVTGAGPVDRQLLPRTHDVKVFNKPWSARALVEAISGGSSARRPSFPAPTTEPQTTRVLLVQDQRADAVLLETALCTSGQGRHVITHVTTLAEAKESLRENEFDVVCLELRLPDAEGVQAIIRMQAAAPHLGLVVLSHADDDAMALKAVQAGAQDFLVKGQSGGPSIAKAFKYAIERKRAELRLAEMAFRDQLTGLANRTMFRQRIAQAINRGRADDSSFAILLLNVDRFKPVNDALGHDAGDAFLIRLASRLQKVIRPTDTAARLGSDEFAILVNPLEPNENVQDIAQSILRDLGRPLEISGVRLKPTASIGVALFPASGVDSDALLAAADAAMYVVKSAGRNGVHVHGAELTRAMSERFSLETKLREAVEARQFLLHYQPQVDEHGRWIGAEALLRWAPPGEALVPAYKFVPLLEETGLILELGAWIVDTACKQLRQWRDAGLNLKSVAVNLSAKQFVSHVLVDEIQQSTRRHGLDPSDLELELTETALLHDSADIKQILDELHQDGYAMALDDFGTGYSSLAYLQRFPISTLKIDRSFVMEITTEPRRRALVGAIVHLAQRLGLEVIAEGVETKEQLQVLAEEKCTKMQGYLFGKPMGAEEFAQGFRQTQNDIKSAAG